MRQQSQDILSLDRPSLIAADEINGAPSIVDHMPVVEDDNSSGVDSSQGANGTPFGISEGVAVTAAVLALASPAPAMAHSEKLPSKTPLTATASASPTTACVASGLKSVERLKWGRYHGSREIGELVLQVDPISKRCRRLVKRLVSANIHYRQKPGGSFINKVNEPFITSSSGGFTFRETYPIGFPCGRSGFDSKNVPVRSFTRVTITPRRNPEGKKSTVLYTRSMNACPPSAKSSAAESAKAASTDQGVEEGAIFLSAGSRISAICRRTKIGDTEIKSPDFDSDDQSGPSHPMPQGPRLDNRGMRTRRICDPARSNESRGGYKVYPAARRRHQVAHAR